ncbi:MAG TPA: MEDS domain-containing protein [Candidatus Angelobacter sp.]|nr:MEDS domain-containing protein [Candidatus Angelobacter sp.]
MSAFAPVHSVFFYDTDMALVKRLCGMVSSGFDLGKSALIVATHDHCQQLIEALEKSGVDADASMREARLWMRDARGILSQFMVGDRPNPALFLASVGQLLKDAQNSAGQNDQNLVVFGEMVALLWNDGNKGGALELECLWNNVLSQTAFHLHCAYPRSLFSKDATGMMNVCESHSHVFGAIAGAN